MSPSASAALAFEDLASTTDPIPSTDLALDCRKKSIVYEQRYCTPSLLYESEVTFPRTIRPWSRRAMYLSPNPCPRMLALTLHSVEINPGNDLEGIRRPRPALAWAIRPPLSRRFSTVRRLTL